MELPNQHELQTLFSGFLFEAGLSAVSVKNYLSDLRHFFNFCASISTPDNTPTVQEIFQSISKYINLYNEEQLRSFTPQNTINRRLASIRRFSTFLAAKYGLDSDITKVQSVVRSSFSDQRVDEKQDSSSLPTISKILEHFKQFLIKEKKTHSTVKNYVSDLNHFFAWSAKETPFLDQELENILSESQLNAYVTYLKLSHTSTSVINRRQSSIKKFTHYCFFQKFIPLDPFENKVTAPRLAPLSWFSRFTNQKNAPKKASNGRLAVLYRRYNALPFTPYLHLAILVLATSAMVIFGYNQIVKQAAPSSAALPTVPRRQLSFQGRLTDTSGTQITTAVNLVFKLWNASTDGTQLYTSNTCSITPDQNGIFNTLIGDGTCGQEIASTVFTENRDVFLEITVGSETLTPRQQIATVGYALNSETLQGYPASASATANTIPLVDGSGNINLAVSSPSIISNSGTFTVTGQALTLSTATNSGGDIILQPDALGGGQVQVLGATTNTDTFRVENANLTSGSLISGYIGNNTATGNLLSLTSGSTETERFIVGANGRTFINTNGGTDSILSASSAGITRFTIQSNGDLLATGALSGLTGLTVNSGTVSLPDNQINNNEISELDWTKLQNYPSACPAGQAVQAIGDTLTCVDVPVQYWQRTDGSLAPLNITDSFNLGATATSSALVHLAGTSGDNSFINTGNFGIGTTAPTHGLTLANTKSLTLYNTTDQTTNYGSLIQEYSATDGVWEIRATGGSSTYAKPLRLQSNFAEGNPGVTYLQLERTTSNRFVFYTNPTVSAIDFTKFDFTSIASTGNTNFFALAPTVNQSGTAGFTAFRVSPYLQTVGSGAKHLFDVGTNSAAGDAGTHTSMMVINSDGNVGLGLANPSYKLDVVGDINLTGALFDNGSAGTAGQILSTTGTGVQWIDAPTSSANNSPWDWNTGVIFPFSITDAVNLGNSATASATVHLAGNSGDNSFINTGNFGVGLTNPSYKLDVVGDVNITGALRANGSAGNSGQVLSSTGTGLSWIDLPPATTQYWQRNNGVLSPINITDAINLGATATTSALVHLAGTAGDNSWINNGFFGIGTTNPTSNLYVLGSTSGNLFTINDGTKDLVNVSSAQTTFNNPTSFTSSGDVSIAYNLNFTNITSSLITSDAPLSILAGETYNSSNLTFQTYNKGNIILNTEAAVINGSATVSGQLTTNDLQVSGYSTVSASLAVGYTNAPAGPGNGIFSGFLGLGLTNPGYRLDVVGDINLTGALRANGSAGTAGQILSSTGTGLSWIDAPTGGSGSSYWQENGSVLSPISILDAINLGNTATNSATVHLAGTTGDNSFINTGNFGIGTTNPGNILDVFGAGALASTYQSRVTNGTQSLNFGVNSTAAEIQTTGSVPLYLNYSGSNNTSINASGGNVGIGLTNPSYKLDVTGDINLTGALRANGSAGTSGQILSSTGTGTAWVNAPVTYWQRNSGAVSPINITDSLNLGATATTSALVHLAGTAGENSFINTGNFGVGTTTPDARLAVKTTPTTSGTELVTNGTFTGGTTGWTLSDSATYGSNNVIDNYVTGNTGDGLSTSIAVQSGKTYLLRFTLSSVSDTNVTFAFDNISSNEMYIFGAGSHTVAFTSDYTGTDTISFLGMQQGFIPVSGSTWTIDDVSIQELTSNPVALKVTGYDGSTALSLGNDTLQNTALGLRSFASNTTGFANAAIGYNSLYSNTTGYANVAFGPNTLSSNTEGALNTAVGAYSQTFNTSGEANTSVGTMSLSFNTTGSNNAAFGVQTMLANTTGSNNAAFGTSSLYNNTIGTGNAAFGTSSLANNVIGDYNSAFGTGSLGNNESGYRNVGIGMSSLAENTAGSENSALGYLSLYSNIAGNYNTGIGSSALYNTNPTYGNISAFANSSYSPGSKTTVTSLAHGLSENEQITISGTTNYDGDYTVTNVTFNTFDIDLTYSTNDATGTWIRYNQGSYNTALGFQSGYSLTTGSSNIFLGYNSGYNLVSQKADAVNSIAIGYSSYTTKDNQVVLGNIDITETLLRGNVGIGLINPAYSLDVAGNVNITGQYLVNGSPLSTSNWQRTLGSLAPLNITDSLNLGSTATSSAIVHLAGTLGENSWINTGNFGIGTTTPTSTLEIAGATSVISNTTGDITINSASGYLDFAGDSLKNILNASVSGQIQLASFTDAGRPVSIGTGSLIYSTTQGNPQFYDGSSWRDLGGYFRRTDQGVLYPKVSLNDSINLGASDGSTASAKVRLSGDATNNSFFLNPIALGFTTALSQPRSSYTFVLQTNGGILPKTDATDRLGYINNQWKELYLSGDVVKGSTAVIALGSYSLTGAVWHADQGFRVGDTSNLGFGMKFEVAGNASISGVLNTGGNVTVAGGAGKIDVGTVDPPYTINGQKYATYMASMIGIKEETVGKVTTTESDLIAGLGYRTLIDLDQQPVGSDIWLFSQTTNLQSHINDLSVLLTPEGQAKAWYEVDTANKILAIYSSTPTNITYRLTAPRFDSYKWTNKRTSSSVGHVLSDPNNYTNTDSIFDNPTTDPELIANIDDNSYSLIINGSENKEISSFFSSIIANLRVGAALITDLVADNLTVRNKLISPLAEIDQLNVKNASVSGTLYADNIQGETIDFLHKEINALDEKYSTASAILADLQAKYGTYGELLGSISDATVSGDPLALSPLATTSAVIPSDLALNSLNVHTVIANDLMANGSIFTKGLSSFDSDLYIQPAGNNRVHLLADLMVLYPDGKVVIKGDLLVVGNVLAEGLSAQVATVSGTLAVGNSTIASDSAKFNQLTTSGIIIASGNNSSTESATVEANSNATIGNATIATGAAEINILNKRVTDTTLIYVTPTSDTNGQVLFVKSKLTGVGFTVAVSGTPNSDNISFNYWLVETK